MRPTADFSLELTAQELLDLPDPQGLVEIEDICNVSAPEPANTAAAVDENEFEIELTADEIDALLSGSSF